MLFLNNSKSFKDTKSRLIRLVCLAAAAMVLFTGCSGSAAAPEPSVQMAATTMESPAQPLLPAIAGRIAQVVPMRSGVVAVLYTDGTVGVAGDETLAQTTAGWTNVIRLYCGEEDGLGALCGDGTALSTSYDLSGWTDLKELHFKWSGVAGLTQDGRVLSAGRWEEGCDPAGMEDIRSITFWHQTCFAVKNDGTVVCADPYSGGDCVQWKNVRELRATAHDLHAILEDGSVVNGLSEDTSGLWGAVKTVDYNDWLFGLSADGQLLTENGQLYAYGGIFSMDPSLGEYSPETAVDISRYKNIKDFLMCGSLLMLKYDGTVEVINCSAQWDFSAWEDIVSIYGGMDADWVYRIYGVRQDGSVVVMMDENDPLELDNYLGWRVRELFRGFDGMVGITPNGRIVGDGAYATTDLDSLCG